MYFLLIFARFKPLNHSQYMQFILHHNVLKEKKNATAKFKNECTLDRFTVIEQ